MSEQIYNPELKGNEIDHSKVVNQNIEKPTIYGNVPSYQVSGLGEYKRDDKVNMADVVYGLDELNYQRADLQSGAELTGKFFANLASEAVIETLKVPGYLFELGEFVANGFEAEDGFNNEYLDKLNSFKEPTQFDIYKTQSAESGSIWEKLSDPTFIASQGQTVGTTLSLMVPGIGVAGLTGKAVAGLGKAAQIGLSGVAAGLFSRGIESAMEGNSIYNEYLQDENRLNEIKSEEFEKRKNELSELKSKYDNLNSVIYNPGSKDEAYNLNNAIRNGQIIEIESRINGIREEIEESSKNRLNDEASRASTLGFSANMALAPLDMLEYALLLKPFSSIKKGIDAISKTKIAKVIGGAVAQPAMESAEEGAQFIMSKEAIGAASGKHDFFNNGFSDRLSNYIEDPEFHESVALGGAMGLIFSGAGPLAKNVYNRISKNVSKFKDDKVLKDKDKDKVADKIVSRALINSDDTYDYLEREKVRIKQFSDSEIEKAKTEEEKSEIKSKYDSIISDLDEIRELDESLKSDEVFIDNPNARKQYVLAKYDYKKNLNKKNEAKSKFEEEFNSIDINSDFSNINLKEGATISEVEEITSNLLKENISLTSYENVRREISKIKSKNSELKSKAEKTIDESIKHTKNRIESLQSQLNEKVNNHNEALPVVPNMESMVNNMTNFIKANIDETFFIKPILNSYSTAKADLIKKKENEIAKKVNDKAQKILEDELSNIIDSTDATVEELNKKKEDIKAFESKSGFKISKKIKSKLDDKLKNAKIKYDLELIEQKNKYIDKINNSNVEELESIAEELRSDSSIEEATFDELINIILSKQINAQNDKINKENELKNIIIGTDKSGKDVKGEHVKRNNKDFIKSDDKLIPVTNIRKPEIINPVIEKDVVKPEEIVFKNTNKNTENTIGFYNQPIGEVQESEIESTQLDNKENESLLTTKVKEFVNDNGKILDAYDESGELIVADKNKLELSSQNNYNEGDEVIFIIDKTFLKEVNGEWFVVYGNSLSKLTKDNLPIGIQTVKDFKDKKPLIGWVKASKQSNGDKQLRSFLYKELVENGVPNFNKTISSIISKKGEGWINKTKVAKLFNKQFKKINKDGAFIYPSNIALAHSNINNEIIGTDEEGNILKSKIQDSPGTVHLVFKNSNGTVNSIRISQKPISKHSESLRKEWVTNVFRIIIDHALGNREFTDDANDVRREVSKYFNLNTFADKSLQEKIRISNDDEYNNFFGFGIDANSGDMILQLPGNNGFPFMQFKIVKSDDNLFILKYGKDGEYNNISSSELLKEFYERLGNMFPNIVSDRLSNFRRLEFDNKSKKLQWTQPKHYFDFLSEYKIAETKLHALVTESGEAVYTTSPMIIVDNNIKHLSESDNIKPEVSELFESNPELANSVYEALEFTGNISDEQKQQKADIERRRQEETLNRKGNTISQSEVQRRFIEKRNSDKTQEKLTKGLNHTNGDVNPEKRWIDKDDTIFEELIALGVKPDSRGVIDNSAINNAFSENESKLKKEVNEEIKQEGLKRVTDEFRKQDDKQKFEEINAKYDAELAELNNQITPEQKQQAQQLYSSYLQTTNNPTIEGFKQWNNRQKQTKVSKLKIENPKLFDSNPELANAVYEALGFDNQNNNTLHKELNKQDKIFLHGSKTKISKFDKTKRGSNAGRNIKVGDDTEHGVFLTDDLETAEMYGELAVDEGKGEVTKVKVNLKAEEIYNIDFEEKAHSREKTNKAIQEAKEKGYKAVAFNNIFDGGELSTSLLVFDEDNLEVVENGEVIKYNDIYNANNQIITPQQKQEAQQLYSSYLQTTNNPTIEGFKQWNNRQQQTKVSKLKIENPADTNELASPKRKVGRPKKQIQKKENLPPLPKGKYALDKDTDSLNNEVSDLSPEDYNNASLKSFNANIDVLNTLVSNVLERLDSQLAETGNTNLEEALNLEKEDLFEMYNIYNFFSKENISKQLADEYGISTKASDNATMANNFKQIYDNFEKIVNSKDEITFIGYRDLITTNIKKLKFSILNEINEDESDGDKVLETYVENRNFKENPEKSMSGKIRRLFYKIPVLLKDGKVKGNILGQKVFHDSSNVFNQISDILIDTSPEDMISELENAAYGENGEVINDIAHGVLVKLYELQKSNPETIQMFKSVMKKQQANFITLIYEPPKVKNGYPIAKIIYTNRASSSNSIVSDWQESFYDKIIEKKYIGDDGKIDENFGKQLYKTIDSLKPGTLKEDVLSILSEIGISFNEKAYLSIVKDFNKKSKYFIKRFGKKAYSEDLILFFKNELFPIANSIKNGNNPFESEARAILNFAAYEAKFSIDSTSRMFKNSNGDNIFTYVNPSHASNLLNRLINNLDETTKLIKDPFIGKSTILNSIHNYNKLNSKKELTESEVNELKELSNEISYLKMFYFEASKNKGGWAIAREYETQSVVERELTKISLFLNNGKNSGIIFNPTPSDKTTFSLFQFKKFDTSSFVIKDGKIVSKVDRENEFNTQLNKLISLFVQSEIDRINHVISLFKNAKSNNNFSKLIEGFHYIKKGDEYYPGVGAHFMFMTNLNDFTANNNMRNQDGSISITNDMSKMIVEEMKFGILELINSKIDSWKNFGLIENGKFKYIDKSVSSKSIDGFAIEYVINNMVGLANEFMMKTGDPAQFAKINTDNIDISFKNSNELIEQTHFNMFKRIAKDIAPGREADWGSDSEYNVLMIDEPKINSKLGNVFSKYKKAYSNIKLADAQEWTTLKEHLTVKLKYGEITKEQYDELLEAGNNKNLSFNQILLVLNPMKPVQVMNEFDNELGQYVSTYIKTSSFPLIPQLTEKFKELDNVREFMELNNINRIVPKSAVKTGFRKSFDLKNITNSKFTNNFVLKNQNEFLIKLNRSGFRIQQDVPYSFSKEHYKEGSQLRKLIFANLLNEDGTEIFFNVNNSEYSGFELKKLNDEIHQEFYERRFDKLLLKLGAVKTSDGVFLPNVDEIRNLLIQEAESRGYSINDILALKSVNLNNKTIFETSLFFHPMVHKIEQLLTSIIKNKVLVNKYPGKSFVQGSSLNFNVATEDLLKLYDNKNSVIFSKDYNPEDGLQYKVNEDGSVVAQVFITMPFKDSKGQPLSIENYLDVNNKIDFNKLPKNMLEMIGYRIPTQGPNSMVKLEVVGILPEVMGDLVIVPPEITVQMGSDFDVDKLNIHWYNYNVDKYGVVSKINYNEEEYLLYKKFVKSKILEKEDIDEELLDSIDDEVKALLDNNYSKFKKSWNNYRKKLSKTLGNDKIVKEFVLDDEYKNVWLPKFKEVSEQIVKTYTISQISELASDYDIISFDEFKKMPMVKKLSMKQLENLSIDTYMSVLSSGLIAERIIAPLENNYFDEAIEYINSLKGNNKSKKSEIKLNNSVLNEKLHSDMVAVQSAGKIGVAIESMASTFHALSQFAGLSLINNPVFFSKKENGDDIYTDADINNNMSPTGNTMNPNVKYVMVYGKGAFRLDKVFSFSGRLISDIISNIQTEAVDNANNRKLHPMNLNPITFDVANLIARVGFDEKIIGLFLNQPIILEYVKRLESLNSFFDADASFENVKSLQVEMLNGLGLNISINDLDKLRSSNISIEEMENSISNNDLTSKTQLIALQNFIIYSNIANELRDIQSVANIDTKFLGSSISELEEKNDFFKNQNIKEIGNWENLFYDSESTKTTQGSAYEYGVTSSIDLFKNILPIDSIFLNKIKSNIERLTKRKIKSKDIEKIQIDLRSAIYWHVIKDLFNIDTNTYRKDLISGENNLGKRLIDFKNSNKNNSFTNSLSVFRPNSKSEHIEVHHFSSKNDKEDVSLKKQLEWLKMLNSDKNSEEFKLGFDLLIYATTFGTEKNANDFSRFIPIDYLRNSGILSGINKFSFNETNKNAITIDAYKSFYSQFLRHNPRYASKFDAKDIFFEKGEKLTDINNEVIIDNNSELYDDNGRLPFAIKTYVDKELRLYFRSKGNKYSRVGLLGSTPGAETNLLSEYDLANKYNKSIFNDNFNKEFNEYVDIHNTAEKSPEDVILSDYNFNSGIEAVLKRISIIGTSSENKELAKLYLEKINLIKEFKLEEYNPENPIHYNAQKGENLNKKGATIRRETGERVIVINKHEINTNYFSTKREDFEHTFLHEIGHSITVEILLNYGYATKEQRLIIDEIDKIISEFKDDAPLELKYFFKNNREFVTSVLSNKKMQNYLNSKTYKTKNLLSEILNLIKKLIGYNPVQNTALSAAMDNILRLTDSISESQMNEIRIESKLPITIPTYVMDYATKIKNKCL